MSTRPESGSWRGKAFGLAFGVVAILGVIVINALAESQQNLSLREQIFAEVSNSGEELSFGP